MKKIFLIKKGKQINFYVNLIVLIFYLSGIYYMSDQTGKVSDGYSITLVTKIMIFLNIHIYNIELCNFIFRKFMHFSEYAILSVILYLLMEKIIIRLNKCNLFVLFFSCFYAITDEIHQFFVANRSPKLFDVLIDTSGAAFSLFIFYFYKRRQKFKRSEK